jgi:3-phenylpropionate/trans-cinnamate dioxygenase ferredoxin subunit
MMTGMSEQREVIMTAFAAAGTTDMIQDGQIKLVKIKDREIMLAKASGKYYAADGRCPHLGGRLWLGKLDGTIVTCPLHKSRFDLVDGHVVRWTDWGGVVLCVSKLVRPPHPLRMHEVRIEGSAILISEDVI